MVVGRGGGSDHFRPGKSYFAGLAPRLLLALPLCAACTLGTDGLEYGVAVAD